MLGCFWKGASLKVLKNRDWSSTTPDFNWQVPLAMLELDNDCYDNDRNHF